MNEFQRSNLLSWKSTLKHKMRHWNDVDSESEERRRVVTYTKRLRSSQRSQFSLFSFVSFSKNIRQINDIKFQ